MNEGERHQLKISSTPRLSPEEVAGRAFSSTFRGISESEVRAFLRRVAEELTATRERERELTEAVDALEDRLRTPPPLDEQRMLDVLGEETTRLIRSAKEAAADIRAKAEERAAAALAESQEAARLMRKEAEEILGVRAREADVVKDDLLRAANEMAEGVRADVERFSESQRLRVESESKDAIEAARAKGREMLEEAKSLRERVLIDLGRRRALLQGQIEELRSGRDQLLDAYRVVKRTFLEATEALATVEARAVADRAPRLPVRPQVSALVESATPSDAAVAGGAADGADPAEQVAGEDASGRATDSPSEEKTARTMADVDSLFARLREEQSGGGGDGATADEATCAGEASNQAAFRPEIAPGSGAAPAPEMRSAGGEGVPDDRVVAGPPAQIAARDVVLVPLVKALAKLAKRAARDEQNEMLDAVRRQKGRATSGAILAGADDQLAVWSRVIGPGLAEAYAAGFALVAGSGAAREPDPAALAGLVGIVVAPLRERLAAAIDEMGSGEVETDGLVAERIGARYREWKTQALEGLLGNALAAAHALGAYDAAPEGALLHWVADEEGHCPDCDDNALEPTAKGAEFPTGQSHPPAHPGCRCVALPAVEGGSPRAVA